MDSLARGHALVSVGPGFKARLSGSVGSVSSLINSPTALALQPGEPALVSLSCPVAFPLAFYRGHRRLPGTRMATAKDCQ